MRGFCIVLIILTLTSWSVAQNYSNSLLNSSQHDFRVVAHQLIVDSAGKLKFHIPLVKALEGKIGINGSTQGDTIYGYLRNEDHYGLTVRFNSFREIRSQKNYKDAVIQSMDCDQQMIESQTVNDRYELLAAMHDAEVEMPLMEEYKNNTAMLSRLFAQEMELGQIVEVRDFVKLERNHNNAIERLNKMTLQAHENEIKLARFYNSGATRNFETHDFITIDDIEVRFDSLRFDPTQIPALRCAACNINLASAGKQYASAQGREILDALSIGYDNPLYLQRPNKFNTLNNYSLRATFKWPLTANNNFRNSRAWLDVLDADYERSEKEWELRNQYHETRSLIKTLLEQYKEVRARQKTGLAYRLLTNTELQKQITPHELLELRLLESESRIILAGLEKNIIEAYLNLLKICGTTVASPRINELSHSRSSW
ncbi:MAG: hypothetical protein K1X68_02380 [Saprospiraceae bacterium]|nr:hypothetical protein [Saprospiraceae bacterium]HMW38938.1 hypothetical protein [Saprospiraceae bacterium]HMX88118.1 hypothetical protein [Saprospiraceae bacterium]HMZ38915.1 hypothetical protein [Saprospiraceae bacterium]HNA64676.1 hypothetical protein [Saprospiraceae bacterium]